MLIDSKYESVSVGYSIWTLLFFFFFLGHRGEWSILDGLVFWAYLSAAHVIFFSCNSQRACICLEIVDPDCHMFLILVWFFLTILDFSFHIWSTLAFHIWLSLLNSCLGWKLISTYLLFDKLASLDWGLAECKIVEWILSCMDFGGSGPSSSEVVILLFLV